METQNTKPNTPNQRALKLLPVAETVLLAIIAIGALLKFSGQSSGSLMLIAGLSSLGFYYMIIGALVELTDKKFSNDTSKIAHGAIGVAFSVLLMGILFHLQMWPNLFGILLVPLLVGTLAIAVFSFLKPQIIDKQVGKWVLPRIVLIAVPVIFFSIYSNADYYALQGKYRQDATYMKLYRDCKDHRQQCEALRAYEDSLAEEGK